MLEGNVVVRDARCCARSDADDAKRGMLCRISDLVLQRLEAASQDIGFAEAEFAGELLQPASLPPVEIHLNWLADAVFPVVMRPCHDIMLYVHETHGKSPILYLLVADT